MYIVVIPCFCVIATCDHSSACIIFNALSKISDLLTRAVTLAEQSASETVGSEERVTINEEYQSLLSEIDRVVSVTNFKGSRLFDESGTVSKSIFVGDTNFASTINISIGGASGSNSTSLGLTTDLTTASNAQDVLGELNSAIGSVSSWRGSLGAQSNRLTNAVSVIKVQAQNILAAKSNILDADIAQEISNMNKFQILMQSGMSSLAQANASSQLVMSLFK